MPLPPLKPFQLIPRFLDKVWGSQSLSPWFPDSITKTGEAWFTEAQNQTTLLDESGQPLSLGDAVQHYGSQLLGAAVDATLCPLLVKFLFTSEKLSVQVHPNDAYAREHENSLGKTEMWHILRAEPGASVAAGFHQAYTREEVERAALDGSIEQMLRWWPVEAGDTIFIPAGTVHAIGPGLVLCEIQQTSDVTYRLYDYGRPRELHIEKSLAVANLGPHPGPRRPHHLGQGRTLLATSEYFRTEKLAVAAGASLRFRPNSRRLEILIVLTGEGRLGDLDLKPGNVAILPATGPTVDLVAETPLTLIHTFPPR
jgi:mannose-6-phosphate isomerase